MSCRVAALAVALAGAACAPKPPPALPAEVASALSTVPPALDAAEVAIKACPQPGIALHAQMAIQAARAEWRAANGGEEGALIGLKTHLELIRSSVDLCRGIADYQARCRGEVRLGMTKAEVKETVWCAPTKIVAIESAGQQREEWVYAAKGDALGLGRPAGALQFTGDRLTAIRRSSTP